MSDITVPIRSKNADGKTVTTYSAGINCPSCDGKGYVAASGGTFDTCGQCKGRGALVRDAKPLPQIEEW